jgi:hypothetical protein
MIIENYHVKVKDTITTTTLNIPLSYKKQCIKEAYSIGDKMNQSTNAKCIMSTYKVWHETKVYDLLLANITSFVNYLNLFDKNRWKLEIDEAWSLIYKKGHFTMPHSHWNPHSQFSFVYYLQTDKDSSPLIFDSCEFSIEPKEDLLVLFPSYLTHSVPTQISEKDRVCIAGNLYINEYLK